MNIQTALKPVMIQAETMTNEWRSRYCRLPPTQNTATQAISRHQTGPHKNISNASYITSMEQSETGLTCTICYLDKNMSTFAPFTDLY